MCSVCPYGEFLKELRHINGTSVQKGLSGRRQRIAVPVATRNGVGDRSKLHTRCTHMAQEPGLAQNVKFQEKKSQSFMVVFHVVSQTDMQSPFQ
jgi:hypothetical protein